MNIARTAVPSRASSLNRVLLILLLAVAPWQAFAASAVQSYKTLRSFEGDGNVSIGETPRAPLIQGSDGWLYGTTYNGGNNGVGTVFKTTHDGSGYTVLHSFSTSGGDGQHPATALVQGSDGTLYGTTENGGGAGYGTVFRINCDGAGYVVLHSFDLSSNNGITPDGLIQGNDGALYGTTLQGGGGGGGGTVFKMNPDGSAFTILHTFDGGWTEGFYPLGLMQGTDGALYGTNMYGPGSRGTLYKISPNGSGYVILHHFSATGFDGKDPGSALVQGIDGMLYGTTNFGGSADRGTVFKINLNGSGYAIVHDFQSTGGDGQYPESSLMQGNNGSIYGTTWGGGAAGVGTVFKVNPDGAAFATMHSFQNSGGDGQRPQAALVRGSNNVLYGSTSSGGGYGLGTVFKISPDGSDYSVLINFHGGDGLYPTAELVQGYDGAFYGTTRAGGSNNCGTVYTINPDGTGYRILYNFQNSGGDGKGPECKLVQAANGSLYGTTVTGGTDRNGTVFKINPDGSGYAILHHFSNSGGDGQSPQEAGLIQGSDGALYGTTDFGGSTGNGTVFKINPDGSGYAQIYSFRGTGDGSLTLGGLTQGTDGALYGTTNQGGSSGWGTIFKVNPDGTGYTILRNFQPSDWNGYLPLGGLIQGSNAILYGMTASNGGSGGGAVYKINLDGSGYTMLYGIPSYHDGNSQFQTAGLVQASDGTLYGRTSSGGAAGAGAIIAVNSFGGGRVIFSFRNSGGVGVAPYAGLTLGNDGLLYGTTLKGGSADAGTIYCLNPVALPTNLTIIQGTPQTAMVGTTFSTPLKVLVMNSQGQPVSGFNVVFNAPTSGAGCTFSNSATVATDLNGIATAPPFTANTVAGGYTITASVDTAATPVLSDITNAVGPFAGFALVLSSPQSSGVGFLKYNTLTAQDSYGNTVATFDASVDNVMIVSDAPLAGTVTGLGTASRNTLDRLSDFVSGVADLSALGMTYTGVAGTGTFTATSKTTNKTGTSGSVSVDNAGPLARFALALSSPQSCGAVVSGVNTLTAQDANGNTVTTFDASLDNVKILANTPLNGIVSGLGSASGNTLDCSGLFVSGVADLSALGMIYAGAAGAGTFTATPDVPAVVEID